MSESRMLYLTKAEESLRGAESEYTQGRYNNTANRCYYACFQAAIAALSHDQMGRRGGPTGPCVCPSHLCGATDQSAPAVSCDPASGPGPEPYPAAYGGL